MLALVLGGLAIGAESTCRADSFTFSASSEGILTTTYMGPFETYSFYLTSGGLDDAGTTQYSTPSKQSGLVFDLSALPKGDVITSATFSMTAAYYQGNSVESASADFSIFSSTSATLTQADFFGSSGMLGGSLLPNFGGPPVTFTYNDTSYLQSAGPYIGFLQAVGGDVDFDGTGNMDFPTLSITYTGAPIVIPEPSSLALCGIAGFAGAGMAWKRRKRVG